MAHEVNLPRLIKQVDHHLDLIARMIEDTEPGHDRDVLQVKYDRLLEQRLAIDE